jgi:hypothetical protein
MSTDTTDDAGNETDDAGNTTDDAGNTTDDAGNTTDDAGNTTDGAGDPTEGGAEGTTTDDVPGAASNDETPPADPAAQVELLRAENRRLRSAYAQARRSTYRRTAVGLATIGAVAGLAGVAFPASGTVLFSLAGIGGFAALLTYYLTPERFVAATVGEAVYTAHAENGDAVTGELGLADQRLYVPLADPTRAATLYVPQKAADAPPAAEDLEATFVANEDGERGVSLRPAGGALFREFERSLAGPLAEDPGALADQLGDGLVASFELADGVDSDVAADGTKCVFGVDGSAFGAVDRFDHPIASFLAVGLAVGLDRPVETTVTPGDDRVEYRVTCSWTDDESEWMFGHTGTPGAGDGGGDAEG